MFPQGSNVHRGLAHAYRRKPEHLQHWNPEMTLGQDLCVRACMRVCVWWGCLGNMTAIKRGKVLA